MYFPKSGHIKLWKFQHGKNATREGAFIFSGDVRSVLRVQVGNALLDVLPLKSAYLTEVDLG